MYELGQPWVRVVRGVGGKPGKKQLLGPLQGGWICVCVGGGQGLRLKARRPVTQTVIRGRTKR